MPRALASDTLAWMYTSRTSENGATRSTLIGIRQKALLSIPVSEPSQCVDSASNVVLFVLITTLYAISVS